MHKTARALTAGLALVIAALPADGSAADTASDEPPPVERPSTIQEFMALRATQGRTGVIAHRGFSGIAPENTLVAIQKGIDVGADMVEIDVGLTRDRHVVVLHDETLDRTTDGTGKLSDRDLDYVRGLDAGTWFSEAFEGEPVPTLDEVLDLVRGKILLNVEIKGEAVGDRAEGGIADRVLRAVRAKGMLDQIVISSFEPKALAHARELDAEVVSASLYNRDLHAGMGPLEVMAEVGSNGFNLSKRQLTEEILATCHGAGKPVAVYTVNDEKTLGKLVAMGVDAIFTDHPDRLLAIQGR